MPSSPRIFLGSLWVSLRLTWSFLGQIWGFENRLGVIFINSLVSALLNIKQLSSSEWFAAYAASDKPRQTE
jgi:hypothetical protein